MLSNFSVVVAGGNTAPSVSWTAFSQSSTLIFMTPFNFAPLAGLYARFTF